MLTRLLWRLIAARRAKARKIFRYHNGQRWCLGDPVEILRAVDLHPTWIPKADIPLMAHNNRLGFEAANRGIQALREIFQICRADDGGLTEDETWAVWVQFCNFLAELKKKSNPPPTSSPPTGSGPDGSDPSITTPPSDCGSTEPEPPTDASSPS